MTKLLHILQNARTSLLTALVFTSLFLTLSSCSIDERFDSPDYAAEAQARGFLNLQPISYFAQAPPTPGNIGNIAARAANLRGKIRALSRPVFSDHDRSRLQAAIARNVAGR